MVANLYKINENGRTCYTHTDVGIKVPEGWEFVKEEVINGEVKKWNPFVAEFKKGWIIRLFKCPVCGCESLHRPDNTYSNPHFWEGDFECDGCKSQYNYYSDCFITVKQSLFD